MRYLKERWAEFAKVHKPGAWTALDSAYMSFDRHYHNWLHIETTLRLIDTFHGTISRPDLLSIAAFWHDVVYQTQASPGVARLDAFNVSDSAELFWEFSDLGQDDTKAVYDLIMATAHHRTAQVDQEWYHGFTNDFNLFLDFDLSGFGAPWERFSTNNANIRREFAWVPVAEFIKGNEALMRKFLDGPHSLYRDPRTRALWETPSTANLRKRITELEELRVHGATV